MALRVLTGVNDEVSQPINQPKCFCIAQYVVSESEA